MYCHMQVTYKDYNTCVLNNKCVQLALLLRLCCDHIVILILICLQFFVGEVILRNLVLKDSALVSAFLYWFAAS